MKVLAQRLLHSSRQFIRSSLAAYDSQNAHVFMLHAGTALEQLMKASLADVNPLLIAKRDHLPSLVWFAQEENHTGPPPVELRSITLDQAFELVAALGVSLSPYRHHLTSVQRHRNAVAHLGVAETAVGFEVLPGLLNAWTRLAERLDTDPSELFGPYHEFVLSQLDAHRNATDRILQGRIAQAHMRFTAEYGESDAAALWQLRELVEMRWHRRDLGEQLAGCVVCDLPAYAEGTLEIVDWEPDFDREGRITNASPIIEYHAHNVRCPTCGLSLDTPELIQMSGILENWSLPDNDYDSFMRHYYEDQRDWSEGITKCRSYRCLDDLSEQRPADVRRHG